MKHDYEAYTKEALNDAGKLSACYSVFHNYSICNQFLAYAQLGTIQPINTYNGWKALGRQVKKGEKAIALIMPVTINDKATGDKKVLFISRNNWFGLSQTDGESYQAPVFEGFALERALSGLGIEMVEYRGGGNSQGYAIPSAKQIAINPMAAIPAKTTFHEIAHCLLHSEAGFMGDEQTLGRDVREVEAELTAYICLSALGQANGLEYSRGYIQNWMQDDTKEKVRYSKVFAAADKILKAGKLAPAQEMREAA